MTTIIAISRCGRRLTSLILVLAIGGCGWLGGFQEPSSLEAKSDAPSADAIYEYIIGPGDVLNIFVWRNPDVSLSAVPVRPDGKLSSPLVEDLPASGKTAKQLARDIESALSVYIQDPKVTVTVVQFVGRYNEQIRIVGEAITPMALSYRKNMTVLDAMIQVGGLTKFAAGNRARLIRHVNGRSHEVKVRLEDLLQGGDISANIEMLPGDVLIIPEALF